MYQSPLFDDCHPSKINGKVPDCDVAKCALGSASLAHGTQPEWLTEGQTVLILRDHQKGAVPSKYRPITHLWKHLSGIITDEMWAHESIQKQEEKRQEHQRSQALIYWWIEQYPENQFAA